MDKTNEQQSNSEQIMKREDWNQRYNTKEFIWTVKPNRFLEEEVTNLKPGKALDLAAGEGRNSVWLAENGWKVSAVDFSDAAIEKAGQLASTRDVVDRIDFQVADLRNYEPKTAFYDLVMLIYLQLSQTELAPIFRQAAAAVAPGGRLLVIGHDSENLEHGYGGPQFSGVLYTAEQVVEALDGSLIIEKAERVRRRVETKDGSKMALDCLVVGRRS